MPQPSPGHVGDVQQAVHSIEIDECAEVSDVFHRARYAVAHIHAFHEFQTFFASLLLDYLAPAEHDIFAIVVEFNDFEIVCVANKLLQVLWGNDIDLRCRQKALASDVHHQAAFHYRCHLAFDEAVTFERTDDLVPILAVRGFLLRENNHALFVFEPLQKHVHLVADLEGINIIKFRQWNDALGFVSDVHQHFARPNFQNASLDDASLPEVRPRLGHYILHVNHKIKWASFRRCSPEILRGRFPRN